MCDTTLQDPACDNHFVSSSLKNSTNMPHGGLSATLTPIESCILDYGYNYLFHLLNYSEYIHAYTNVSAVL